MPHLTFLSPQSTYVRLFAFEWTSYESFMQVMISYSVQVSDLTLVTMMNRRGMGFIGTKLWTENIKQQPFHNNFVLYFVSCILYFGSGRVWGSQNTLSRFQISNNSLSIGCSFKALSSSSTLLHRYVAHIELSG